MRYFLPVVMGMAMALSDEWKMDLNNFEMVEGISGVWFYHLKRAGNKKIESLCGAKVMCCDSPTSFWGFSGHPGHIRYAYCKKCEDIAEVKN